jgi:hypothetical protein
VKITLTLVADCDPPPREPIARSLDEALDDLCYRLEDELAGLLLELEAGFAIDTTRRVEP